MASENIHLHNSTIMQMLFEVMEYVSGGELFEHIVKHGRVR